MCELSLLAVLLFVSHCSCASVCVKEKTGAGREMSGVCTVWVKHMVGRSGHVGGCMCA